MPEDFWPENIADSTLVSPVTILKEQATLLGQKTRQLVTGEIVTKTTGQLFIHSFFLIAPTVNYRYELFNAQHHASFYPLMLRWQGQNITTSSEEEFKSKLKEIFSAKSTLNLVHSLISQLRP